MIAGTLIIADMVIHFTLPELGGEKGTVSVSCGLDGAQRTVPCTHAELGAALALAIAGDEDFNSRTSQELYRLAEAIQPDKTMEGTGLRWIP